MAIAAANFEGIVPDKPFVKDHPVSGPRLLRVRKVIREVGPDELVPRIARDQFSRRC